MRTETPFLIFERLVNLYYFLADYGLRDCHVVSIHDVALVYDVVSHPFRVTAALTEHALRKSARIPKVANSYL